MKNKSLKISIDVRLTFYLNEKNFKYVKRVFKNLRKNGIKLSEPKAELDGLK